jgi:hypothetical protein
MPYYTNPVPGLRVIRRVEVIEGGEVIVTVNGKEVRAPIDLFAQLAVEEVEDLPDESTVYGIDCRKCKM